MADENIRIQLTAVDKTRSGLASVTRGLRSVTGAVFSMRTAIASLVGVGGLGLVVKQSLSATDALAKTASKIGTTTEQLSRLQFAASISGISIEQTNMALQRLVRRTAEAAEGTGEAQGALRELGIDARAVSNIDLDVYMLELADAFKNVESESQRLRLAFKLFDSEGAAFVNVLNQGSGALDELFGEAQALGLVMRANVARSVENANDAFTKLGFLFRGLRDQIVGALAPALEAAVTSLTEFLKGLGDNGIEVWARNTSKLVLETFAGFVRGIGKTLEGLYRFANGIITVINVIGSLSDSFVPLEEIGFKLPEYFGDAADQIQRFADNIGKLPDGLAETNEAGARTLSVFERIERAISAVVEQVDIWQSFSGVISGAMNQFTQAFTDGVTGAKNFADAVKDMARSVINSLIKMLVQYYITKPLFDAISGFIGGIGGSPAPTGGAGAGAGMRAVGGPVSAGSPYIVGERGPELFIPSSSGQVQPNGRMGGGGVTVNQNINISTGVAQTVRAEVLNLMPQIAESAKAAVADSRMRGGGYSKALIGM